VRHILGAITDAGFADVKTVCIGGINESNARAVIEESGLASAGRKIDGVAVVSAIMAAPDPMAKASTLSRLVKAAAPYRKVHGKEQESEVGEAREMVELAAGIIRTVADTNPLTHNMTNLVRIYLSILYQPPPTDVSYLFLSSRSHRI
jgi:thiamine-phosphate diphosphorylase / hydroxyethylthiazole kinase